MKTFINNKIEINLKNKDKEEGIYLIIIPHQYNCYNEEKLYKYIDEKIEEWEIETKQDKILEKGKKTAKKISAKNNK